MLIWFICRVKMDWFEQAHELSLFLITTCPHVVPLDTMLLMQFYYIKVT